MSADGGTVWNQRDSYYNDGGACIVHPESTHLIFTGGQGPSTSTNWSFVVSGSRNSGMNWTRFNLSGEDRGYAYALAVSPAQPGVIYAGGCVLASGAVYRSDDYGRNWLRTLTWPADTVTGLAPHPENPDWLYAATLGGLWRTTDAGNTWTNLRGYRKLRAVLLRPLSPESIFVAGDSGVAVSSDGGQSWAAMNTGLPTRKILSLAFTGSDGSLLIAGTDGRACYGWSLSSGVSEREIEPQRPGLAVYPNPVTGKAVIRLPVSANEDCQIRLRDVAGRVVWTRLLPQCPRQIALPELPCGAYHLEVRREGHALRTRVVVLRSSPRAAGSQGVRR